MGFVALVADHTARYAFVHVPAQTWKEVVDILEDIGCEVIEDQTEEYEPEDLATVSSLNEFGILTIDQLQSSTDFVATP